MLTKERLLEVLKYDPITGIFTCRYTGKIKGSPHPKGHLKIKIDGETHYAHRLAFLYMNGKFPQNQIDHKNLDPSDNVWENLREATHSQNRRNTSGYRNSKTGMKGVSLDTRSGLYKAQISTDDGRLLLGMYEKASQAKSAYDLAAYLFHQEFARC